MKTIIVASYMLITCCFTRCLCCMEGERDICFEEISHVIELRHKVPNVAKLNFTVLVYNTDNLAKLNKTIFRDSKSMCEIRITSDSISVKNNAGAWERTNTHAALVNPKIDEMQDNPYLMFPNITFPMLIDITLEYEYCAIIAGYFWDMKSVKSNLRVDSYSYSVVVPDGIAFYHKTYGDEQVPKITANDGYWKYTWTFKDIPPLNPEAINSVTPVISVSTTADWKVIADYYLDLFQGAAHRFDICDRESNKGRSIQDLRTLCDQSKKDIVQEVKHYISDFRLSSSHDAFVPGPAVETFRRKRGDCKDLVVLMVSLLDSAGVVAYPVLLNKDFSGDLEMLLPNPYIFNHAIVLIPEQEGLNTKIIVDCTKLGIKEPFMGFSALILENDKAIFSKL